MIRGVGAIDRRVRLSVFLGGCRCCCGSISLEAQPGGAFLGRGIVRGRQGSAFSLDIALQPFSSRSRVEHHIIYHVLSVCFCQSRKTKIS